MRKIDLKNIDPQFLIIGNFALAKFLFHMLTSCGYGYFRDEFYYLACSNHLSFGYVDQPPLAALLLAINTFILGDSTTALRFLPALAAAVHLIFLGLMVRELGGKTWSLVLVLTAWLISPIVLGMHHFYSMNGFDYLIWSIVFYLLIKLIKSENQNLWLWLGLVLGIGLMNKISVLWLGFGILVGILATENRKQLKTRYPWLAFVIAIGIFSPYIIWNIVHNLATLEFIHTASTFKNIKLNPIEFMINQLMETGPTIVIFSFIGIVSAFVSKRFKKYRIFAWIWLTVLAIMFISRNGKGYYFVPVYPAVFIIGAITIEDILKRFWRHLTFSFITVLTAVMGLFIMPVAVPILPVEKFIEYGNKTGIRPSSGEHHQRGLLPQFYADMFGWENMARQVSCVYSQLPEDEKDRTVVYGQNYGEAGAIDFYRSKYELPPAISGHNNYWIWGPGDSKHDIFIVIGGDKEDHLYFFDSVVEAGTISSKYAMPYENNLTIYVCKGMKMSRDELWEYTRHYN